MKRANRIALLLAVVSLATWWLMKVGIVPSKTASSACPGMNSPARAADETPDTGLSLSDLPERDRTAINVLKQIYAAPISIYGRALDEKGTPVGGAAVEYSLNDKYFKEGTKGTTTTDALGRFRIQGTGVSVYVHVQRQGYYTIPGRSNGSIRANQSTSLEEPAVFYLTAAGSPQSLTHMAMITKRLPLGIPMEISLTNRKLVPAGLGCLRLEVWVDGPPQGHKYNNFPWHCRVSVPGGGIVERTDQMAFEAPAEGYQTTIELSVKPGENWRDFFEKDLWLHLADNSYARGKLYLSADSDAALVSFDSYWNQTGSRNLEAGANDFGRAK